MKKGNSEKTSFIEKALADLNKSDADLQREKLEMFVENSVIECETQIGLIKTSKIPTLQVELKRAENELKQANAAYDKVKYTMTSSFESYVSARNEATKKINKAEDKVASIKTDIQAAETLLESFVEILSDLNS